MTVDEYLKKQDKDAHDIQAELKEYAPKLRDLLDSPVGQFMMRQIDLIAEFHTIRGDSLSETQALRCYDAARGAREVAETLKALSKVEEIIE